MGRSVVVLQQDIWWLGYWFAFGKQSECDSDKKETMPQFGVLAHPISERRTSSLVDDVFRDMVKDVHNGVVRARRAAVTRFCKAGFTSSQRRVFNPQSGFTQMRSLGITFAAARMRPSISSADGTRGEGISQTPERKSSAQG